METIVGLVAAGLGVALVPELFRSSNREGVVFRDLAGEQHTYSAPDWFSLAGRAIVWRSLFVPARRVHDGRSPRFA
ncbi:hypothetical protein [Cupriavidus gilardii]|uniref:hypothetical protein n=1 Tax=Cupriavidus gilardii TaxID=82541 RepID=UPI0020C5B5B4|nr:hypothetical protein [Cupriavidus gilardii]